ncbi:hypothetical protein SEVIR_9G366266v4 [Setaria viridis]
MSGSSNRWQAARLHHQRRCPPRLSCRGKIRAATRRRALQPRASKQAGAGRANRGDNLKFDCAAVVILFLPLFPPKFQPPGLAADFVASRFLLHTALQQPPKQPPPLLVQGGQPQRRRCRSLFRRPPLTPPRLGGAGGGVRGDPV